MNFEALMELYRTYLKTAGYSEDEVERYVGLQAKQHGMVELEIEVVKGGEHD